MMKKTIIYITAFVLICIIEGCKKDVRFPALTQVLNDVENVIPAEMFDGYSLTQVSIADTDSCVEMEISYRHEIPYPYGISREEEIEGGRWFVENMMKGYRYTMAGHGGEGDSALWKAIGPLLEKLAQEHIGIRFTMADTKDKPYVFTISSDVVSQAIRAVNDIRIEEHHDQSYDVTEYIDSEGMEEGETLE